MGYLIHFLGCNKIVIGNAVRNHAELDEVNLSFMQQFERRSPRRSQLHPTRNSNAFVKRCPAETML